MADPRDFLISYSTNVHRGETLASVYGLLDAHTVPILRRVFGGSRAGLELRLGIRAARELLRPGAVAKLRDHLEHSGLELFSVNAFPLLDFHADRVKEKVYRPSWAEAARPRWTAVIARILSDLLPPGIHGTVSTLGGAFRPRPHPRATLERIARGYLEAIESLHRIESETGKRVLLAVEPEPCTTFETARDVVGFFESWLVPTARERWRRRGRRQKGIDDLLRRYFTVNFDTCHFSVLFEDLKASLATLESAGIAVGKVHVTSALSIRNPARAPMAYREFRGMEEPRYFHQFCGRDSRGRIVLRGVDLDRLPARMDPARSRDIAEIRTHYHVPLYLAGWKRLGTTRDETRDLVTEVVRRRACRQLVVETYTWPTLASEDRLHGGIARELEWLVDTIRGAGPGEARGSPSRH